MCGRLSRDFAGQKAFGDKILVRAKGVEWSANINERYMNAREETLWETWLAKGCAEAVASERIASFWEQGIVIPIPEEAEIKLIVTPNNFWCPNEIKVVTRPDGWEYKRIHGKYPDFVDAAVADFEHTVHSRWPVLVMRH